MSDPSDVNSKIVFNCGNSSANVYIDNIVLKEDIPNAVEAELNHELNYSLNQNYPNPFNPTTTIKYSLPAYSELAYSESGTKNLSRNSPLPRKGFRGGLLIVTLKIYDILGREVSTLVNQKQSPGNYEVQFDGTGLSSGIYFYELTAGSFRQSKKMLMLK